MTSTSSPPFHRIVVGVDGSDYFRAGSRLGHHPSGTDAGVGARSGRLALAGSTGMGHPPGASLYSLTGCGDRPGERARPLRAKHPGVKIESRVVEGHPAPVLVEASKGADLLVVGSRGHGEFAGMLLGSVSEHCVSNAPCPVLVLRGEQ